MMNNRIHKNNNLRDYQKKLVIINEALVKSAIARIQGLSGEISFAAVSRVTHDLTLQNGGEGLTSAGITKNKIYRALVEEAMSNQKIKEGGSSGHTHKYSTGDMQMSLHALRVKYAQLKEENKILKQELKEVSNEEETVIPISDSIIRRSNALHDVAKSMVNRMCELEIAYLDADTNSLKLAAYNDIIVPEDALNLFYKKELDEIRIRIHGHASRD